MKINLKDAFLLDHYEKNVAFRLEESAREALASLADFPADPAVSFSIRGKFGAVHCDVQIDCDYKSYCARCLAPVSGHFHLAHRRQMVTDPMKEEEGTILIDPDYTFCPEEEAVNQIILEFPERFLCTEDCKGLCPVCGCNRNLQSCACETPDEG